MVAENRQVLHEEKRERDVKEAVIDLGVPRPDLSAPRLRKYAQNMGGARKIHVTADSKKNPLGKLDNGVNCGGSPNKARASCQPGRRHASVLYIPNPRLYKPVPVGGKSSQSRKTKAEVNKRAQQRPRGAETVTRVKRRKHKTRQSLPNPRLYQAPPNRPRVPPLPPLRPRAAWSPPPQSAPQQTASQIALQFSERHIIPFRELLPAAIKSPIIKPGNSQLNPFPTPRDQLWELVVANGRDPEITSVREKKLSSKSQPDSPRQTTRDKTQIVKSSSAKSRLKDKKRVAKERTGSHVANIEPGSLLDPQEVPTLDSIPNLTPPSIPNYVKPPPPPKRYRPRSSHFRLRTLDSNSSTSSPPPAAKILNRSPEALLPEIKMAASPHSSITPEEVSDGNDSISSAPSEYLAEFLSAIMSRKYADALKYCRLILHYEPQNSTARGFYPLLRYKLGKSPSPLSYGAKYGGKVLGSSNSEGSSSGAGADARSEASPDGVEDLEERSDSEAESVASLSLDSSGKSSRSASPAARGTDSTSECSAEMLGVTAADVRAMDSNWLTDDNGNPQSESNKHNPHGDDKDDENDNAASGDHKLILKDPALRQLRAQFACSIK